MKDESKTKKIEKEILSLVEEHLRIKHKKHDFLLKFQLFQLMEEYSIVVK